MGARARLLSATVRRQGLQRYPGSESTQPGGTGMRVLITTDVMGGVWQFTHELAAGLLRQGSAVALVSLGGDPNEDQSRQCAALSSQFGNSFRHENCSAPL